MEQQPLSGDVTPLRGPYQGSYRRRVGSWRIIFTLKSNDVVAVADILRRTSTTY
jgi:mRNA-degrading endonuclease RelE of RelBE toxin-antitoxin system